MTKSVLLHIGTHKTGTTSIQHTLDRASRDAQLGDIVYPRLKGRHHNFLAALYRPHDRLPRPYRAKYSSDDGRDALVRDVETFRERLHDVIQSNDKIILSAECLSRFTPGEAEALRDDLRRLGVRAVCVVVYVRDPASRYLSHVQQALKAASQFQSPNTWRGRVVSKIRTWNDVFPNVVVRPFLKQRLEQGDVVQDFLSVAGDFFGTQVGNPHLLSLVRNQSISAEGMVVLQRYRQTFYADEENIFKTDSDTLVHILDRSRGVLPQTPARLSSGAEQTILRRHARDLEALWRAFDVDLRGGLTGDLGDRPLRREDSVTRRSNELTDILQSYDEAVVDQLLLYCLRDALLNRSSGG